MLMVQAQFSHLFESKVVWVDASWNLKPGMKVSFETEDDRRIWVVDKVYETKIEAANLSKKWGLDLPKSQRTER